MGQTTSSSDGLTHFIPQQLHNSISSNHEQDYTSEIPDECLSLIFQFLRSDDKKRCSLVCRRWFTVEGQSHHRLALNASNEVAAHLPAIFTRFNSVTKLALHCDRKSVSINDEALTLISLHCSNLSRLKLRGCREISDQGMSSLALNCKSLRKLSCSSCMFGAKGMNALLNNCSSLEELSVKRLRGIENGYAAEPIGPGIAASSLKLITLKELYNGQCFSPLIIGSKNLKSLKILRCLGDWDRLLEEVSGRMNCLSEILLERVQVSDVGLKALSKCPELENLQLVKTPDCSDLGISAIAENCKLLRKLYIDGWRTNRIGDEGLIAVAKNNVNLVELVLIGVNPSSMSLMEIASNCQKLERLAICGSETVGDAEILCLAEKCRALKKLCIKGCQITDSGMEAFAFGCPNLVKIKVKKCRGVSGEVADWLRARRMSLDVNLDSDEVVVDTMTSDGGAPDDGVEFISTSNGTRSSYKSRFSRLAGRTLAACAFQRLLSTDGGSNDR